jgi:hypothetical protein
VIQITEIPDFFITFCSWIDDWKMKKIRGELLIKLVLLYHKGLMS